MAMWQQNYVYKWQYGNKTMFIIINGNMATKPSSQMAMWQQNYVYEQQYGNKTMSIIINGNMATKPSS